MDLGWALHPVRERRRGFEAHRGKGRRSGADTGRDWSDAATSQGCLEPPEVGLKARTDVPSEPPEGSNPANTWISRTSGL